MATEEGGTARIHAGKLEVETAGAGDSVEFFLALVFFEGGIRMGDLRERGLPTKTPFPSQFSLLYFTSSLKPFV